MIRVWLAYATALSVLWGGTIYAATHPVNLPPGITCEMVREAVRTLPKETLDQYKKSATPDQLKEARKCLQR